MLLVNVAGQFQPAVGGAATLEISAVTIRELFRKLSERYPKMQPHFDEGVAVSINGEIFRDEWSEAIPPDAEVFLLPRIQGG